VRQVVTVASPFRLPTATTLAPIFRALWRRYDPAVDLARLARPLPVPAMAICTRHDGIVAWRNCVSDDPSCPTVELTGAHLTSAATRARSAPSPPGWPRTDPHRRRSRSVVL
jgi:hypothetical protein